MMRRWPRGARGWAVWANLALLALWPVAWVAPLAEAGLLPWIGGEDMTVLSAVALLWDGAPLLAVLVALFGVALPYGKTLALAALHRGWLRPAALPMIEALARLSMADVFLVALYVVVAKGVGVGYVTPGWGLWLFTGCVGVALWAGWASGPRRGAGGRPDASP